MSKIKEHFHDEICAGTHIQDKQYAVDAMSKVANATNNWISGRITSANFFKAVVNAVADFENWHEDACPPQ